MRIPKTISQPSDFFHSSATGDMAARGHITPGMMRHGPFPGGLVPTGLHPLEGLPPTELLENKMAAQAAEMERFVRENQRLAGTQVALRQELVATQQEMQRLQSHIGSIQTESDIQIRGLLEKIAKMEADLRAGESLKKELQQAHAEAQSLVAARQDLTAEIQQSTQELQKVHAEIKKVPEMHSELDGLRQEHQKLRVAFEYEKGLNMEQVEQMHAMEKNLVSMAREVEKLRAEVLNADKRARAPNPYAGTYGSPDPAYPSLGQGAGYADGYGRPQVPRSGGAVGEGMIPYVGASGGVSGGSSGAGIGWGGSYDAVRGAAQLNRR